MTIKLTKEEKSKLINGGALYEILQKVLARETLIDRQKEHLWVAGLDVKGRLICLELVSLGNEWMTAADPVAVFARALQKECKNVVIAHNHSQGHTLKPSKADFAVTEKMVIVGRFLKCPVVDHLVINEQTFYSMRQHGHIAPMEKQNMATVFKDLALAEQLITGYEKGMNQKDETIAALQKQLAALQQKKKQ
jgi:DNA repair protein RadC